MFCKTRYWLFPFLFPLFLSSIHWSLFPPLVEVRVQICFSFRLQNHVVSDLWLIVHSFLGASCFKHLNWTFWKLLWNLLDVEVFRLPAAVVRQRQFSQLGLRPLLLNLHWSRLFPAAELSRPNRCFGELCMWKVLPCIALSHKSPQHVCRIDWHLASIHQESAVQYAPWVKLLIECIFSHCGSY